MQSDIQSQVSRLIELLQGPFWKHVDFWVFLLLSLAGLGVAIAGLLYSIRAFKEAHQAKLEAQQAKQAATEAGRTVKAQTVAIELGEISQRLERLQPDILFSEARELLNEVSRRLRRAISPFAEDPALKVTISAVRQALDTAQSSLKGVRPTNPGNEREVPGAVYNGIEADFATIGNLVADLLGLFEKQTFDSGVRNAKS
jgi:hypothetical protein